LPAKATSKTLVVPDDYPTVSLAIENALSGDTIFVKSGIYPEKTLKINKPLSLIGEDVDKTILNLDPPLVEIMVFTDKYWVPSTAITITTSNVRLSGFTINMPGTGNHYPSGLIGDGDKIEIVGNKIGKDNSLDLNGNLITITNNSLASELTIKGSNQTIVNNSVEGGFECRGFFNTITANTIGRDMTFNGSFNLVNKNSFQTVYLEKCDSNIFSGNSLKCLWLGWSGGTCFNNSIIKNKITGPGIWGILMSSGSYNLFHSNLIINYSGVHSDGSHYGYGIAIGGTQTVAEHNIFYHNILKDNFQNVGANWEILGAGNYWDNGKEGNYWDDYTGTDNDGDGIGDVPFRLTSVYTRNIGGIPNEFLVESGQDNYPLMAPFDIDSANIDSLDWADSLLNPSTGPQTSGLFPTATIAAVSAAVAVVVAAGLLVYFRRKKKSRE
jgi:hypothetical protein